MPSNFDGKANQVRSAAIQSGEVAEGLSQNIFVVYLASGRRAIFRTNINQDGFFDHRQEIATYLIDQKLKINVVPITLERTIEGQIGALQIFIPNTLTATRATTLKPSLSEWPSPRIRLLDVVIGNRDRNTGNWLYLAPTDYQAAVDSTDKNGTFAWNSSETNGLMSLFRKKPNDFNPGSITLQQMHQLDEADFVHDLNPWIGETFAKACLSWIKCSVKILDEAQAPKP